MGKISPSYLFNENGDLSFLLHFLIQCLVGNIQEKFQNNCWGTFISEELPKLHHLLKLTFLSRYRL